MKIKDLHIHQLNSRAYSLRQGWKENNKEKYVERVNEAHPFYYAFISDVSGKLYKL